MQTTATIRRTLIYYDGPVVFLAEDAVGTRYICQLFKRDAANEKFLCTPISAKRYASLMTGEIDLRHVFTEPETPSFFITDFYDNEGNSLTLKYAASIQETWLPGEGVVFTSLASGASFNPSLSRKAIEKHTAILELSLNPPEAREEHKIEVVNLAEGLSLFNKLVRWAFADALRSRDRRTRESLKAEEYYTLEAFAQVEGSYAVQLQARTLANLYGEVELGRALSRIDELVAAIDNVDRSVTILRNSHGYFVASYKNLLRYIVENNIPVSYAWCTPANLDARHHTIPRAVADPLYQKLLQMKELEVVSQELEGYVVKADTKNGSWTVLSSEDEKEYQGVLHENSRVSLDGIIMKTQRYRFHCEERLEESELGRKVRTKYLLESYEAI